MGTNKITFNNLMTHWVFPNMILSNIDDFYRVVLDNPGNLLSFMKTLTERSAKKAVDDPSIESIFEVESYEIGFYGELEHGVIWMKIPNCEKNLDCCAIAFPSVRENAGYFTCEYSDNELMNRKFFVLGGWKIENGNHVHQNYGETDGENVQSFAEMIYNTVYH